MTAPAPLNLAEPIFAQARQAPERPAIVIDDSAGSEAAGPRTLSYGAFAGLVAAAMQRLLAAGIDRQRHVALRVREPVTDLIQFTALTALGVGIYPTTADSDAERAVLARLGITTSVSDDPALRIAEQAFLTDTDATPVLDPAQWPVLADCAERPWLVMSSSGTTGVPKVFRTRHCDGEFRLARIRHVGASAAPGFCSLTPIRFGSARQRAYVRLMTGDTVYLLGEELPLPTRVERINRHRIGALFLVPLHLQQLCTLARQRPDHETARLFPHEPVFDVSTSTISPALDAEVRHRLTPNLINVYGANEIAPFCAALTRSDDPAATAGPGADVGHPLPGIEIAILDDAGRPLPPGTVGRIAARAPERPMDVRYLDASGHWVSGLRDGWFLPGDLGQMTADGRLRFLGRADDLIVFNGINIFPDEIEQAARCCAGVRDACAFGVPHRVHQQVPMVAVIPDPGFDPDTFMAEMRRRLGNRRPRRCRTVAEFPRNAMGKTLRRVLVEQALGGRPATPPATAAAGAKRTQPPPRFIEPLRVAVPLPLSQAWPAHADDWALPLLGEPAWGPGPQLSAAQAAALPADAPRWLGAFERLARLLLNLVRVPLFDPLPLAAIRRPDPDAETTADTPWPVTWQIAVEPFLAEAVYTQTLKAALSLLDALARSAPTPAAIATVHARIEREVIARLKPAVPAGKSTMPVLAAAHRLGIPYFHLGLGVYQLGWGARARRLDRSTVAADSALGSKLAQNKRVTANLLRMAGLPAPVHAVVVDAAQARAAAARIGYPVVVKPADRDRGEGVVVDITEEAALVAAFDAALALSRAKQVIVERQVPGLCHRLFVQDGRLLYAVQRGPMSVRGDGRTPVRGLIAQALAAEAVLPPWQRSERRPLDALAEAELARHGLSADSVPAAGAVVPLRRIESTEWGGVDVEVSDRVHPDNLAVALAAARLFSLNVAGIDLITPDIAVPWHANGAIVNEVNYAPLLGGAEISRRHLPAFLKRLMGDANADGRIPLVPAADAATGRQRRAALAERGLRAWMTSARETLDAGGRPLPMPEALRGLRARVQALLCRDDVDALVIVESRIEA